MQANYRDFLEIIDVVNAHLAPHVDFCVLPGDNADDGTPDQSTNSNPPTPRSKWPSYSCTPIHTHYSELANDGTTLFATTRSTGQNEEGPVGFSIVTLDGGVVTWRFKPLRTPWPLVTITSAADHRLLTDVTLPDKIVTGSFAAIARGWGASPVLIADGSDADALEPSPERHLLGARLSPNRNGRRW